MEYAPGIGESAHDLAAIVDPDDRGPQGARDIDLSKGAIVQEKAMKDACGIYEFTHDLASIIDRDGRRAACKDPRSLSREFNLGEHTFVKEIAMKRLPGIQEIAHDLASIIDLSGLATRGPGKSIWVKAPSSKRYPWNTPPASSKAPTIWPRSLMP